ncbi:PhoPQ-activated pathogenicity-related family protein [Chitinophaga nivalis]|uniref:PhoPQ-activated pathogenicity-related family protein n=1 Tax=Chitinophaga nivalis TaxID=2991709 RepID=A0ABT3IN64_9BACT|nr:PhoPQ-activated pathogenicity-related family protein [Chitinophaga nivalis]MCW3464909.1 PhoPQ-activated pathogenicity-related family protein [Chitinophaga nivalis]MCW3485400.1 PhoPQ-activated pathogenicity-related family protein [Chitinophaga nivalis]
MKQRFLKTTTALFVNLLFFVAAFAQQTVTPATALKSYLNNGDTAFHYELKDSFHIKDVKCYSILLTSQQWREYTWTHQLTIFVPANVSYDGALLFITGGAIKNGLPNWNGPTDELYQQIAAMAGTNKAITAVLRQTPNQPLFKNLTEDALISYTLHQFKENGDYTWPLLFPMVKSAVRAMDAVQSFSKERLSQQINRFVVSGASKRGWTTWLTGANDSRVAAIAPMVIDVLNMPVSLDYQIKTWKEYSIQIEDYVKLGIPQAAHTEGGQAINTMIDPYSYRQFLTMPKMIFMGTNDEYWVVDNVKNYLDSIPGKNMLHYTPNAGHNLGDKKHAFEGLSAFFGTTLTQQPYPNCSWTTSIRRGNVKLTAKASADQLVDVILWTASSTDLDFRNEKWSSQSLGQAHQSTVKVSTPLPASGYRAFYADLQYVNPTGGTYTVSTRVFVTDTKKIL